MKVWFPGDREPVLDTSKAQRATKPPIRAHVIVDHGQRYIAYDAHSLLERTAEMGRPGRLL